MYMHKHLRSAIIESSLVFLLFFGVIAFGSVLEVKNQTAALCDSLDGSTLSVDCEDPVTSTGSGASIDQGSSVSSTVVNSTGDGKPQAPSDLRATLENTTVSLVWNDRSTTESYFLILKKTVETGVQEEIQLPKNSVAYADTRVSAGKKYLYYVQACNSAGCSAQLGPEDIALPAAGGTSATSEEQNVNPTNEKEEETIEETTPEVTTNTTPETTVMNWQFADGTVSSRIYAGKESDFTSYLTSIKDACRKVSKANIIWMDGVDDLTKIKEYGIPDCKTMLAQQEQQELTQQKTTTDTTEPVKKTVQAAETTQSDPIDTRKESETTTTATTDSATQPKTTTENDATTQRTTTTEPKPTPPQTTESREADQNESTSSSIVPIDEGKEVFEKIYENIQGRTDETNDETKTSFVANLDLSQERLDALIDSYGDVAVCSNAADCEAACRANATCTEFTREAVTLERGRSVFTFIPRDKLEDRLEQKLITLGSTVDQILDFCSNPDNDDLCMQEALSSGLIVQSEVDELLGKVYVLRIKQIQRITERVGTRKQFDKDRDGVTDYDEINFYNTDPDRADSDGDGEIDGNEIILHQNPTKADRTDPEIIIYEDPRVAGITVDERFAASAIELYTATSTQQDDPSEILVFSGQGLPNSFVTLYIFSQPIVVTLRTDSDGAWSFEFDEELEDGSHTVYTALTDSAGEILAKSSPLPFVKEAGAITLGESLEQMPAAPPADPVELTPYRMVVVAIVAVTTLAILTILAFGFFHQSKVSGVRLDGQRLSVPSESDLDDDLPQDQLADLPDVSDDTSRPT